MNTKPVAWLHTMDNTEGIPGNTPWSVVTFDEENPFGKPGVNYSESYPVTSVPLHTHKAPEPVSFSDVAAVVHAKITASMALTDKLAHPAPEPVSFSNVAAVERTSDQSVRLVFTSCYQAGLFERAARLVTSPTFTGKLTYPATVRMDQVAVHLVKSMIHPHGWYECNVCEMEGHVKAGHITRTLYTYTAPEPVDMILHCPACGLQHIDAPDDRTPDWKNEPHRSHLCHGCGHIWRPADVPTNGVAAISTKGKNDSPAPDPVSVPVPWHKRDLDDKSAMRAELAEWRALAAERGWVK